MKLKDSLCAKENKKNNNHTMIFPGGFQWHLIAVEFSQQLEAQNQRRKIEAAEKTQIQESREARKANAE